jgi:deazaflavin-dependent oxidoreductase (nitroreductase family)
MEPPRRIFHYKFLNGIRIFNKYIFNRITLIFAGQRNVPFSILRHVGRRSGRTYQTPVLASYVGEMVLIPLSYGEHVDWLRNILAQGGCELCWQNRWMRAINPLVIDSKTAITILPEKRRKLFERFKLEKFLRMQLLTKEGSED